MKFTNVILIFCLFLGTSAWAMPGSFPDDCQSNAFDIGLVQAAIAADSVLCLNELNGDLAHDKVVAEKCFMNERFKGLFRRQPAFKTEAKCQAKFMHYCTQNYACEQRDTIFGGYQLQCGHLGFYLDFLNRVHGVNPATFTAEDGARLCNQILQSF